MLLAFGVLLLTSSVLSENDKIDTIYKAIKDIIGFDRNELTELSKTSTAIALGKQDPIPKTDLQKRHREFVKAAKSLPPDARRFMFTLMLSGLIPEWREPSLFRSWNGLESKFRGKISKDSCAKLLKKFPGIAKYKLCSA
ncbi:hypothetical protein V3C99_001084 [Haemonchus contortus]